MKKFLLVLFALQSLPCFATTMCASNDIMPVILDPSLPALQTGVDSVRQTWWQQFSYGRISGTWACVDQKGGNYGTTARLADANGNIIKAGTKNGQYCWCKMTNPLTSQWAYFYDYGTADKCAANCLGGGWPYGCARGWYGQYDNRNHFLMLRGYFSSIR